MKKFPKGLRKYIRKEKARIRREILDVGEREENFKNLYESLNKWYKNRLAEAK